jgi:hypothetical protein
LLLAKARAPSPEHSMSIAPRSQDWHGGEPHMLNRRGATCAPSSRLMIGGLVSLGVDDVIALRVSASPQRRTSNANSLCGQHTTEDDLPSCSVLG